MGKSTLLLYVSRCCPSDFWCLFVRLIDFNVFLRTQPNNENILHRFMEGNSTATGTFHSDIKRAFLNNKKIYILLDGLDEVDTAQYDLIINFVKWILSQGANVWITCRENLRDKVVSTLHVVTVDIKELTDAEQEQYLKMRLRKKYEDRELKNIVLAVFESSKIIVNNKQLLAILLQLYIITEILCSDTKKRIIEKNFFVLTKLYRMFFEGKKRFLHEKIGIAHQEEQIGYRFKHHLKLYEIPALKVALDNEDYQKLKIDESASQEYLNDLKRIGEKFGIINHVSEDNSVVFNHQTFAEYFTCVWFSQNLDKLRLLKHRIFSEKYTDLRVMFDILLAEELPLHLAVIYRNVSQVDEFVEHSERKDVMGRKALHLACTYGMKYGHLDKKLDNFNFDEYRLNRETSSYIHILKILVSKTNELERDELFNFSYIDYSSLSRCLYPLEVLVDDHVTFQQLKKTLYRNFDPVTLVFYAAQMGYHKLLCHLLQDDSNLLKSEKFDNVSLLRVALMGCKNDTYSGTREGNVKAIDILLQYSDNIINKEDTYKRSILDYAGQYGCYDVLRKLMDFEANCTDGNSIIHVMAKYGTLTEEIIKQHNDNSNVANNQGITPLQLACENGHTKIVEILLQNHSNPNQRDKEHMNALHFATRSKKDNTEIMILLLKHNVDKNAKNINGETPLHLTCSRGHREVVRTLINNGVSLNVDNNEGKNPLHYAANSKADNTEIIKILTENGLESNKKDASGMIPLQVACSEWQAKNVSMLLKTSNVNSADNTGNTVLHYSVKTWKGNTEVISLLLSVPNININAQNALGKTLLHVACEECQYDNVQILLDNNAAITILSKECMNALHYASMSWKDNQEIVKLLIDRHIDGNARTATGKTALFLAYDADNTNVVKILLKECPNLDFTDHRNMNILHYVAKSSIDDVDGNMMRFLVQERDIDVNIQTQKGKTALHFACKCGKIDTIKILHELGADLNIKDNKQRNAFHHAVLSTCVDLTVFTLLNNYNVDINLKDAEGVTPLQLACVKSEVDVVSTLLDLGADPNIVDHQNRSSLYYAAMVKRDTKIINVLLDKLVNADVGDSQGSTPLSIFCRNGQFENVENLHQRNFDLTVRDLKGWSALHYATQFWKDNTKIMNLLLDAGLNVDARDNEGRNALHLSCKENHLLDVRTLIQRNASLQTVDYEKMSALHYAAQCEDDNTDIINLLISKNVPTNPNIYGENTLHLAAKSGNVKNLQELLKSSMDVNAVTVTRKNLLHYAVQSKNENMVEYVLSLGFEVNSCDILGVSVLHIACQYGNYKTVKLLIDCNANINMLTKNKKTVLHYAVLSKIPKEKVKIVNYLLDLGMNVEVQGREQRNALKYAMYRNSYEMIKVLIQRNLFAQIFHPYSEDFLYNSIYSGCVDGLKLFEASGGILEAIDTNNKKFPLDFLAREDVNMTILTMMTKFIDNIIEYSSYVCEEHHNVKYTPVRIANYLRYLRDHHYDLKSVFNDVESSSKWTKRFSKLQKFLRAYRK